MKIGFDAVFRNGKRQLNDSIPWNNPRDTTLDEVLKVLRRLTELPPANSSEGVDAGARAWLMMKYEKKRMWIYIPDDLPKVHLCFEGPDELDGGGSNTTLQIAEKALRLINMGEDPEDSVRRASRDWQTYRAYEGLPE
jgi:hypothetical protein